MRNVKVILNKDVYNLGEEGDVKEVAPGFARNYLIPQGFAVPYSRQHVALFEQRRAAIEKRKDEKRTAALGLKERIEEMDITLEMPAGDSGKLFGSVTNAVIADRLAAEGVPIERKKIEVPGHTIKMTGDYSITIKLYADESAELSVHVLPEGAGKAAAEAKKADEAKAAAELAAAERAAGGEEGGDEPAAIAVETTPEAKPTEADESEATTEVAEASADKATADVTDAEEGASVVDEAAPDPGDAEEYEEAGESFSGDGGDQSEENEEIGDESDVDDRK